MQLTPEISIISDVFTHALPFFIRAEHCKNVIALRRSPSEQDTKKSKAF